MNLAAVPIWIALCAWALIVSAMPARAESRAWPNPPDCQFNETTKVFSCDQYTNAELVLIQAKGGTFGPNYGTMSGQSDVSGTVAPFTFNASSLCATSGFTHLRTIGQQRFTFAEGQGTEFEVGPNCTVTPPPENPDTFSTFVHSPDQNESLTIQEAATDFLYVVSSDLNSTIHPGLIDDLEVHLLWRDGDDNILCSAQATNVTQINNIDVYGGFIFASDVPCAKTAGTYKITASMEFEGHPVKNTPQRTYTVGTVIGDVDIEESFTGGGISTGGGGSWANSEVTTCRGDSPYDPIIVDGDFNIINFFGNFSTSLQNSLYNFFFISCDTIKPLIDIRQTFASRAPIKQAIWLVSTFKNAVDSAEVADTAISIDFPFFGGSGSVDIFDPDRVYAFLGGDEGWGTHGRPVMIATYYLGMATFFYSEMRRLFKASA